MSEEANVSWPANVVSVDGGILSNTPNPFPNHIRAQAEVYMLGDISVAINKRYPHLIFVSLAIPTEVSSGASYSSFDIHDISDIDLDGLITVLTFIREQNKNDNQ